MFIIVSVVDMYMYSINIFTTIFRRELTHLSFTENTVVCYSVRSAINLSNFQKTSQGHLDK